MNLLSSVKTLSLSVIAVGMVVTGIAPSITTNSSNAASTPVAIDVKVGVEPAEAGWVATAVCWGAGKLAGPVGSFTCAVANPWSGLNSVITGNKQPVFKVYKKGTNITFATNDCKSMSNSKDYKYITTKNGVHMCVGYD